MRHALDRRVAAAAFALSLVAIAVPVASSRAPLPPPGSSGHDPEAMRELLDLVRASESGWWSVAFDYTREIGGSLVIDSRLDEVNAPPWRARAGEDTLALESPEREIRCTVTDRGPRCMVQDRDQPPLDPATVYETATAMGAYRAERRPDERIAGESARCFALVAVRERALPGMGSETALCYAADGAPLSSRIEQAGGIDTRVAATVVRERVADELDRILERFGATPGATGG